MRGNAGHGNPKGQMMTGGGKGGKMPKNMPPKTGAMGPAGKGMEHKTGEMSCTPMGQKVMG